MCIKEKHRVFQRESVSPLTRGFSKERIFELSLYRDELNYRNTVVAIKKKKKRNCLGNNECPYHWVYKGK